MTPGLRAFEGDWRVARVIRHAQGPDARFDGAARFLPDGTGLLYIEEGSLCIDGRAPMRAERRYLWRAGASGTIEVLFEDGRAFHRIAPGAEAPEDRHDCPPDIYDVTYDFRRWPEWRCVWRVRGPEKDYRMESLYRRADNPG